MFLRGRQLLRVHIVKLSSCHIGPRRTFSDAVRRVTRPVSYHHNKQRHGFQPLLSQQQTRELSSDDISLLCDVGENSRSSETSPTVSVTSLDSVLQKQSSCSMAHLPASSYSHILEEAYKTDSNGLIDTICNDINGLIKGTDEQRRALLHSILENADLSKLRVDTLVSVLDKLSDTTSSTVIDRVTRFTMDCQTPCEPLVKRLHVLIMKRLRHYRVPSGALSLTYRPPALARAAFCCTFKLVTISQGDLAMELFRDLYDRGFIPSGAVHDCASNSEDLDTVLSSTLVRASIYWDWKPLAVKILFHILSNLPPGNHSIFELAVDTANALLNTPLITDVRSCTSLFCKMHRLSPVPSALVRQFYNSAAERMLGEEAAAFYSFSRSPDVLKQHRYPPPQGVALTWLMHHLATASKKTYLTRLLATEVVEENLFVMPQFRARFISFAASLGYSSLARKLWIRYATGKDKKLVIGNSALMLRMTSLFTHLIRRTEQERQRAENETDNKQSLAVTSRLHDLIAFRDLVLWSYRRHHDSLKEAPHTVITSFARACFIVGKVSEGFDAFKVLLRRREIPDIYDVNVALSALAQRHPRRAASIVEQIKEKGIQPDAVCCATLMHYAQMHNDSQLAERMMHHLCGMDQRQLSLKSVAALIRMSLVSNPEATRSSQRQKLQDVLSIIMKLTENKFLSSPQTGKYLVATSLRADDSVMAYRFWHLLLRESAEWSDKEHVHQRNLISQLIRQHRHRGWLKKDDASRMLRRLKNQSTSHVR